MRTKKPPDPPNRVPEKKVVETSAFGHHVQLVNREGKAVGFIEIKESDDEGSIFIFPQTACVQVLLSVFIFMRKVLVSGRILNQRAVPLIR